MVVAEGVKLEDRELVVKRRIKGSTDPIRTGKVMTTLGVTIYRTSKATADRIYLFDSSAFGAIVYKRHLDVDPIADAINNRWGNRISTRYKTAAVQKKAFLAGQR
jgi:hypothetical protein